MLQMGHLNFFLDAESDIQDELQKGDVNPEEFQMEPLLKLNLYLAFAKNERGEALKKIFDERMAELAASGDLQSLFQKWISPIRLMSSRYGARKEGFFLTSSLPGGRGEGEKEFVSHDPEGATEYSSSF